MSEEALKMYAQLTQEISLCQDEDLKKLGKGILELANNYDKSLKKNEQLQERIDKAIEYIKECEYHLVIQPQKLLEILGDKE